MSRRWLLRGYLLLMIALVAVSEPRRVGDVSAGRDGGLREDTSDVTARRAGHVAATLSAGQRATAMRRSRGMCYANLEKTSGVYTLTRIPTPPGGAFSSDQDQDQDHTKE